MPLFYAGDIAAVELVQQFWQQAAARNAAGILRYTYNKTGYIGAYTKIPGSPDWSLAAIAPFNESPLHQAKIMLIIAALMFLIFGSIAALPLSNRIAKPYEHIRAQTKKMEKLVEIAEAASNSKSAFLANMSHEIRTPMNAIIGMSDLMPTSNLTVLQKGYFEDIKKMSKSLLQIINDILDFSKIEAGRLDLISVHYNFWSLFDNICSMSKIIAVNKNINFEYEMSQNVPQILYGDEVRVRQVITNVINNAVKYTMHGCVNVTAAWSTDGRESGKGILLISVKDTGIGIREEDRAELFQAFHQLDARKNRSIVGTGLGLAITNELLRLMNGSIDFESVYGKGTTFNIRLPSGTGDKMQVEESDTALHFVSVKPGKSVQVLVVDDIMVNLSVAQGFLSKHNIRADLAGSGAEAVAMARKKRYDLIFMDHLMPDMDGLEATTLIRSSEGAIAKWNKTVPIVALSANAVSGAKESFLKAGMDDFISKPIESRTMNAILSKYLPLEKMEKVDAVASIPDDCEKSKQIDLPPINGVNYSAGFNRFGEKYTYLEIIQSFIHNTPPLLEKIEYFTPDSLNIAEYRTIVHGIKGSARTIGAELVGFKAEQLERAALSHDIEFINNNKDAFIASAKQLISDLAALPLDRQRVRVPKEKKDAPPKELLEKLREACLHYDARTIEKTVAELEQYEYETGSDFITSLGKAIDSFDFSNAATQIRAYQQNAH